MSAAIFVIGSSGASAAGGTIPLNTAGGFVLLAGSGVAAGGANTLNGDLGAFPATTLTGNGTVTVNGASYVGDRVAKRAQADAQDAYVNAADQIPTTFVIADLGGQTIGPGIYSQATPMLLTGMLTLDAGGDPNAVWVFQARSELSVASASSINLVNGAQSCNILWQVAGSAEVGAGSSFNGAIIASSSVSLSTGTTLVGRAFALNGGVSLDANTITLPTCVTAGVGGLRAGDGSTIRNAERKSGLTLIGAVMGIGMAVLWSTYYVRRRDGADA